jgi:hypothetical protein
MITISARDLNVSAAAKTFTVLAYNGDRLRLPNFPAPVVIDLSKLKLAKRLTANLDHDAEKRVGHVTNVDNDGRRLLLTGVLSAATEWRDEVLASYRDGYQWEASVEAGVDDYREVPHGRSEYVNGRSIAGPIYVTASTLYGFAFVTRGADRTTEVAIAASAGRSWREPEPQEVFSPRGLQRITRWLIPKE